MEPLTDAPQRADERFARRFRERARGDGPLPFADFMELALYDAEVGYYTARRERVGKARGTDFYTATTFAGVFGPLVTAAAASLLGGAEAGRQHVFVEVGAEPGRGLIAGDVAGFAGVNVVRLGDALVIPPRSVVFSNELFDAQPFHRLVWRAGGWREQGVVWRDGVLAWTDLPELSAELGPVAPRLPAEADEGYTLDVPWRAVALLRALARPGWRGLFVALDYGRTWRQLCDELPQGSGRAYGAHRLSGDLLACPGAQDLTCHVCWDWLETALCDSGFGEVRRESQEAFFVNHATAAIEAIVRGEPNALSPARSQLKQLLHPGLMGHRFEVLWGRRG